MSGRTAFWRRRIWLWVVVMLLVGLAACYWRQRQPRAMRLLEQVNNVGFIPFAANQVTSAAGFLVMNGTPTLLHPATFTFFDWDGRQLWHVTFHDVINLHNLYFNASDADRFALSPDGHVLAQVYPQGKGVCVTSWRDGHPLGVAAIPWLPVQYRLYMMYSLQVTDSGCVWLTAVDHQQYRLWAVDGTQVAAGSYTPSLPPSTNTVDTVKYTLSPRETR